MRAVVLYPDASIEAAVRALWSELEEVGVPTLATFTHRLHPPHVSLVVADDLPVEATLDALHALGPLPSEPLPLVAPSAGVFPPGVLFLGAVNRPALLAHHERVDAAVAPLATRPQPSYRPGSWVPHVTLSQSLTPEQLAVALPIVLRRLPLRGSLDRAGLEDGVTGEHWPV